MTEKILGTGERSQEVVGKFIKGNYAKKKIFGDKDPKMLKTDDSEKYIKKIL